MTSTMHCSMREMHDDKTQRESMMSQVATETSERVVMSKVAACKQVG